MLEYKKNFLYSDLVLPEFKGYENVIQVGTTKNFLDAPNAKKIMKNNLRKREEELKKFTSSQLISLCYYIFCCTVVPSNQ